MADVRPPTSPGSGRVLPEVLTLVLDSAIDVTKAERGFVEFGRERLIGLLHRCHGMKPDAVLDDLPGAVRTFVGAAARADDITAVAMRFSGVRAGGDALSRGTEIGLSVGQAS